MQSVTDVRPLIDVVPLGGAGRLAAARAKVQKGPSLHSQPTRTCGGMGQRRRSGEGRPSGVTSLKVTQCLTRSPKVSKHTSAKSTKWSTMGPVGWPSAFVAYLRHGGDCWRVEARTCSVVTLIPAILAVGRVQQGLRKVPMVQCHDRDDSVGHQLVDGVVVILEGSLHDAVRLQEIPNTQRGPQVACVVGCRNKVLERGAGPFCRTGTRGATRWRNGSKEARSSS